LSFFFLRFKNNIPLKSTILELFSKLKYFNLTNSIFLTFGIKEIIKLNDFFDKLHVIKILYWIYHLNQIIKHYIWIF